MKKNIFEGKVTLLQLQACELGFQLVRIYLEQQNFSSQRRLTSLMSRQQYLTEALSQFTIKSKKGYQGFFSEQVVNVELSLAFLEKEVGALRAEIEAVSGERDTCSLGTTSVRT